MGMWLKDLFQGTYWFLCHQAHALRLAGSKTDQREHNANDATKEKGRSVAIRYSPVKTLSYSFCSFCGRC
jgi:hypothetical protein